MLMRPCKVLLCTGVKINIMHFYKLFKFLVIDIKLFFIWFDTSLITTYIFVKFYNVIF